MTEPDGYEFIEYDDETVPHRVAYAVQTLAREEIRGVTWDIGGWRLYPRQKAEFAYAGGFVDAVELYTAIATFDAESGGYVEAWHINVARTDDGKIRRDDDGRFTAKSIDLGWIQRNVPLGDRLVHDADAATLAEETFDLNPDLRRPLKSAEIARDLFEARQRAGQNPWGPWYAYLNGSYHRHTGGAALAVGNWIAFRERLGSGYLVVA